KLSRLIEPHVALNADDLAIKQPSTRMENRAYAFNAAKKNKFFLADKPASGLEDRLIPKPMIQSTFCFRLRGTCTDQFSIATFAIAAMHITITLRRERPKLFGVHRASRGTAQRGTNVFRLGSNTSHC
ncbi:hypothetical protein J2W42_006026, partial [Rhizobium tibeticum]|nr:hypothetical protein [Rhizobium tibeticum]